MEHRNRKYYEDMIIVIIAIIILYAIYAYFAKDNIRNISKEITVQKILQSVEKIIDKESIKKVIIQDKPIEKQLNKETVKKDKPKKEVVIQKKIVCQKDIIINKAKQKFVNKDILNNFLNNFKKQLSNNMKINELIDIDTQKDYLKIRVTILENGNYEELKYTEGNKILFDINKENMIKVFPVFIDDKIKDQFPRYVRITIKYDSIKDNINNE